MKKNSFLKNNIFLLLAILLSVGATVFILHYFVIGRQGTVVGEQQSKQINGGYYASGVIPHHLLAKPIIEKFFRELSRADNPQEIILLGPDHFNAAAIYGDRLISVNSSTITLDHQSIDNDLLGKLSDVAFSDYSTRNDHGITSVLPFIQNYFPDAKFIPLLIPAAFPLDKTKQVVEDLNKMLPKNAVVLASVDFSHYLPKEVADFHDQKSIRTLLNFDEQNFLNIEVDCPQCLFASRYFAKLRGAENYFVVDHKNSQDYYSSGAALDSTTSYFSVLFSDGRLAGQAIQEPKTILFLGDIMLDRAVKRLVDKNNPLYSFEKIKNLLKGNDMVVGNLEGPVVKNPQYTADSSMKFNFDQEAPDSLHYAKIDLVSLANNHTLDRGRDGLRQTKELLAGAGINSFGDPMSCKEESTYKVDGVVFIGLNETFPFNCSEEELGALIKEIKIESGSDFLIVFVHWGDEYRKTSNARQRELAHAMIDAGVDLIIGSHPHVVEEVEKYNNKLIFYSLGNFVFDQYFSNDTQQALAVGLEIYSDKVIIRLFPLGSHKSQPYLLDHDERESFLNYLASISQESLRAQIEDGILYSQN